MARTTDRRGWCHRSHYARQVGLFVQLAQDAMAGGWAGQMDQLPFANLDFVASVLAHNTGVVPVRSKVLPLDGSVKNRSQKLAITVVGGGHPRMTAESKHINSLQAKSAGQGFRNSEVEFRRVSLGVER